MGVTLITGGSGFIGHEVSRLITNSRYVLRRGVDFSSADLFEINSLNSSTDWEGAFHDVEAILHLAGLAHNPDFSNEQYEDVNVRGTLRLASYAAKAGVKRFVFVSSIGVNGVSTTSNNPFVYDSVPCPHNAYAHSKNDAELGLKKISQESGLEVVIVRPTLVYGPNAPGNFGLLTKLVQRLPVLPFGLTRNRRDFIAVQNLADLLVTCATHPNAAGHTFLASEGETVSTKEFTDAIAMGLDKKVFQLPVPVTLMRLIGRVIGKSSMVEQLVGNLEVDSSNLKEILNWTPPLTMHQAMATLRVSGVK